MNSRRDFLKKASIGSLAVSAIGGLNTINGSVQSDSKPVESSKQLSADQNDYPGWEVSFEETSQTLVLHNGTISVSGRLSFNSGNENWKIVNSRDGVKNRFGLTDTDGNIQGYLRMNAAGGYFRLIFYHRSAQDYEGTLSYAGSISFLSGSFPCRTKPFEGERVLNLSYGDTNSVLNDSIFSPENDLILRLDSAARSLESTGSGQFSFQMSGKITEAAEADFTIELEKDYFRNRFVPYYHPLDRKRCPKTPTGWMSWNTYFDKATADDNLAEARIGQKHLQPFGCEFWSIESWQGNSPHLPVSEFYNMDLETDHKKFPKGMKNLADEIRKLGFRPGLWMAPFGTGSEKFYAEHKSWFLHDESGKPISCWNGKYTLDPTVDEAIEHLHRIFDRASHDWGYEFFKIDGMSGRSDGYCAHLYERPEIRKCFHNPACPDPFARCVRAFREGIGDDRVFLACQGHSTGPEALYADAARLGADIVHPNEPVKWPNIVNQGKCTVNQVFTHNIAMIADPDTLLVHDLPVEEARVSATIVALPGQLTFFGDKLAGLSEPQMKMLQQTLPAANVRPVALYPYFSRLPVWNLEISNKIIDDYNIAALFNWEDETQTISLSAKELGLPENDTFLLYEFWEQRSYGTFSGVFHTVLPARSVRLFALHKLKDSPQWISSDRHITQNGMELGEFIWDADSGTVSGMISLIGTFPLTMKLHVPGSFRLQTVHCEEAECSAKAEDNGILALRFHSHVAGSFKFRISFLQTA
jgi:hypothetical protein